MGTLNQKTNFKADFGLVFRSSAVFAVFPEAQATISILNYWNIKNSQSVSIIASCRDLEGSLIERVGLEFTGSIINYKPPISNGSVEIEAFGNQNLRIPYAGIMALYETSSSISMVHAYARNHSPSEIEEGRAVLDGREACIGVKADPDIETLAFFHNGHLGIEGQDGKLIISNAAGEERQWTFSMSAIEPYETVTFAFADLAPGLAEFLEGQDGWAALHFSNLSGFPRMLVRWRNTKSGEVQVTHSNFDYSEYQTDYINSATTGYMSAPAIGENALDCAVVVYPRCTRGLYTVESGSAVSQTRGGLHMPFDPFRGDKFTITRDDGPLPSRLVTALQGRIAVDALPFECSVGIFHEERPPKRFHWAVVSARLPTRIFLERFPELYGEPGPVSIELALYGCTEHDPLRHSFDFGLSAEIPEMMILDEIFPDARTVLGENPGYLTMYSSWGGFFLFTAIAKGKSMTIEHSF